MIYWFAYRDIMDAPRKQFERLTVDPDALIIRDQVIPAMFGFKAVHIKRHQHRIGEHTVNLITYTEQPVAPEEAHQLAEQALRTLETEELNQ
jgi:hypothetical protein